MLNLHTSTVGSVDLIIAIVCIFQNKLVKFSSYIICCTRVNATV
jgi:hypothetical protein